MGFRSFELCGRVAILPTIARVLLQRAERPRLARLEPIIVAIVAHEIDRELAAHDQLLQKRGSDGARRFGFADRKRHRMGPEMAEMQVRRQAAGAVEFGMIAAVWVVIKAKAYKAAQAGEPLSGAAVEAAYRPDCAIDLQLPWKRRCAVHPVQSSRRAPRDAHGRSFNRAEKALELLVNTRADGARRKMLPAEQRARHDRVGVDAEQGDAMFARESCAPSPGPSQRILVSDNYRRPHFRAQARQRRQRTRACAFAQDEPDTHTRQPLRGVLQAFKHERVMAQVGERMLREQAEKNQYRLFQRVGEPGCRAQGRIVHRPLRALHPVEHAGAALVRIARSPDGDARIGSEFSDCENGPQSPAPRSRSLACRWGCAETRWDRARSHVDRAPL